MTEADFRRAFDDHKDSVYGFALRMTGSASTAEDIAQECFLQLLRHPDRFDPQRGTLRALLLGVTRNLTYRHWRAENRVDPLDDEDIQGDLPSFEGAEISALVSEAVAALPPLQREAILLFEYEGFTLEEVAAIAKADVGTIKSRLHRAREKLRQMLAPLKEVRKQ